MTRGIVELEQGRHAVSDIVSLHACGNKAFLVDFTSSNLTCTSVVQAQLRIYLDNVAFQRILFLNFHEKTITC